MGRDFHPGKLRGQAGEIGRQEAVESGLKFVIRPFSLAIGLRMEARGKTYGGTEGRTEVFPRTMVRITV